MEKWINYLLEKGKPLEAAIAELWNVEHEIDYVEKQYNELQKRRKIKEQELMDMINKDWTAEEIELAKERSLTKI